jgi:hypothetical protein
MWVQQVRYQQSTGSVNRGCPSAFHACDRSGAAGHTRHTQHLPVMRLQPLHMCGNGMDSARALRQCGIYNMWALCYCL